MPTKIKCVEMEFHEAANLFPMEQETIAELADDIKKNGQQIPIELFEGKIIDGRRRWVACHSVNIEPQTREVNPKDPVSYVLSLNVHRRHLNPSQRSMVAARAREYYDRQARERMQIRKGDQPGATPANLPDLSKGDARDQAGKALGVGGRSVDHATKVLNQGIPELIKAVDDGRMAVSSAAVLSQEPAEKQKEIAESAKRRYTANRGGGAKPQESKRHVIQNGKVYMGIRYAEMAIAQLERIEKDDPQREEALLRVFRWTKHKLGR